MQLWRPEFELDGIDLGSWYLWRCLSYRGSAGGYLLIECRGVAALQMRSSQ